MEQEVHPQPPVDPERRARVEDACRAWIRKLIDPSRRNNLLFFRPLKEGTLDLSSAPDQALAALLSPAAKSVPLDEFVTDVELQTASARVQEIRRRAQANEEERGLETLYLAMGMATWPAADAGRPYVSPVFLMPLTAVQQGTERRRLLFARNGDVQPNLVLLHHLENQGINISAEQLVDLIEGDDEGEQFDLEPAFAFVREQCRSIPQFAIERRFVLGNFSFQKMAMVQDLRLYVDGLANHDLIAAIAQDGSAREKVRGARVESDPGELDRRQPDQEFLVLDADSTQQRAIGAALTGQSGVISGPPGTGKSQTIANLIAECAARGRRVLFVAEKRAALEAVFKRLDEKGLGHLCMDLHGADVSRSKVMERIAHAFERMRDTPRIDVTDVHRRFVERRERLNAHVRRMHATRGASALTIFELQGQLLRLPAEAACPTRWRDAALEALDAKKADEVARLLQEAGGFEALLLKTGPSGWTGATLTSTKHARASHDLAVATVQPLARVLERAQSVLDEARLAGPADFNELQARVELLCAVNDVLASYDEEVFSADLPGLCHALEPARRTLSHLWALLFSAEYRSARATSAALRRGAPVGRSALLAELKAANNARLQWQNARQGESVPRMSKDAGALRAELAAVRSSLDELQKCFADRVLASTPVPALTALLQGLSDDAVTPFQQVRVLEIEAELRLQGVGALLDDIRSVRPSASTWTARFRHAWLRSWLDAAFVDEPDVSGFNGRNHEAIGDEFRALDRERLRLSVDRVRRTHAEAVVAVRNAHRHQDSLVKREAAKKRRHMPLRKLFQEAPDVMMALHPCWMASPLSVSQLLPADRQYFDVVIFDEASQVLPEDAVTSLFRGKSSVVAGDRRQLPPTTFFAAGTDEDGDEETATGGFESLLDVMSSFLDPAWGLDWHYRSRDEALIAFSNHHVYGDRLVTFPGAGGGPVLSHVLVPHVPGASNEESSSAEVERVTELVIEHAETRPAETLGVIAMGINHARRVEASVERAAQARPELAPFFDSQKPERFFVKNLERVQGDEREAIILTVGYGKDAAGRLPYRFGPLLAEGGERRLNVAVTRARGRMTVVSSFSHFDMDPSRSTGKGVELLRAYLEYSANGGRRQTGGEHTSVPLNDFEQAVYDAIVQRGIKLLPQWGASKYRIDMVAQHPERPGRLVLAIECDGATYHSSITARDRDRLRQEHLVALGWRFHRIWSTDWFLQRDAEMARLEKAFQDAVAEADRADAAGGPGQPPKLAHTPTPQPDLRPTDSPQRTGRPAVPVRTTIDAYSTSEVDRMVRWVASCGLKTDDELIAEVTRELGFARRGARIEAAIRASIHRVRAIDGANDPHFGQDRR